MGDLQITGTSTDATGATSTYAFLIQQSATTSPAQVETNLFYGFILFFVVVACIAGFFLKRFK